MEKNHTRNNNHSFQNERILTPKKFLFVSLESLSGDLAWQIKKEGHEVKAFIENPDDKDVYDGFLEKVDDWKKYVDWADVVVFDDIGFGAEADSLRAKGKLVVGGSRYADKLEEDREFGQNEMKRVGMPILSHWDFADFDSAIDFIKKNPGRYVFKPSGTIASDQKGILFLGQEEDGNDLIEILEQNKKTWAKKIKKFQLQKMAVGVEVAVGAFFNGKDFALPLNINFEHKKLFPGDIGPYTGEMGTTMFWSPPNEIFNSTLFKIKDDLIKSGYIGYVDINCIVNAKGIYPLEFTCFSDDTEILTKNGWKLINDVKVGELVATLDPNSHFFGYQNVTGKIAKKYNGTMIHIAGNGNSHQALDCLVTPDHQMYIKQRNDKFSFVRADQIPQGSKIKRTCKFRGKEQKTYIVPAYIENHCLGRHKKVHPIKHKEIKMSMDVWLQFLGIFLAEGSIGGRKHLVTISQSTHKKEVKSLLKDFPFRVVEMKKGFQISSTQLVRCLLNYNFGKCNTKYIPEYVKLLPPKQIKIFLNA
jgi:phosphoribosylamine--glycine ligase